MAISFRWTMCRTDDETHNHLFLTRSFDWNFWSKLFGAFLRWSLVFPRDVMTHLSSILLGHPFKNVNALLWLHISPLSRMSMLFCGCIYLVLSFGYYRRKETKESSCTKIILSIHPLTLSFITLFLGVKVLIFLLHIPELTY